MSAIYSHQLGAGYVASPTTVSLGGPTGGGVWVVRSVDMTNYNPATWMLSGFFFGRASDSAGLWYMRAPDVRGSKTYHWRGRQVLESGDVLDLTTYDSEWSYWVSGYKLTP